jgi:ADP-glucose pyrophosphorylase
MGIYLFNTELLVNVLRKSGERLDDFGGDIIPYLIGQGASV